MNVLITMLDQHRDEYSVVENNKKFYVIIVATTFRHACLNNDNRASLSRDTQFTSEAFDTAHDAARECFTRLMCDNYHDEEIEHNRAE